MIYGYIRVSTDKQDTENQKLGIIEKSKALGYEIGRWISDDGISGTKEPNKRLLGKLLEDVQKDDVIIVSEISRLGRKLFMVFRILEGLMDKGVKLYSVKDGYSLDNTITSKVLAFAFGMAAEIERDMISKRTIEGLARRRAEGIILGRPIGRKSEKTLLDGKKEELQQYLEAKVSVKAIARIFKCHRQTVCNAIKAWGLKDPEEYYKRGPQFQKKILPILLPFEGNLKELVDNGKSLNEIKAWIIENTPMKMISSQSVKATMQNMGLWWSFEEMQKIIREKANVNKRIHY